MKQFLSVLCLTLLFSLNSATANNSSNCSCWKVTGWQQNQTSVILGNMPILQAAKCHQSYTDRVWVEVTIGNSTSTSYWLSISKLDAFISLYTHPLTGVQSYKFAPLLVLDTPPIGTTPPQIHVDALPCTGCPNEIIAQTNCPCPDSRFGCISIFPNQNPDELTPILVSPTPVNPPILPSKDKRNSIDFKQ